MSKSRAVHPPSSPSFGWLVGGVALAFVPIIGYLLRSGWPWDEIHPAINAMLNASAFVFLVFGRVFIAKGEEDLHRKSMVAAFAASSIFLISYLARYAISGTHNYPGTGAAKLFYFVILFSHMILAIALVPMVLRSIHLAIKGKRAAHRRLARKTWPIWVYVSLTGVLVYFMLYQWV